MPQFTQKLYMQGVLKFYSQNIFAKLTSMQNCLVTYSCTQTVFKVPFSNTFATQKILKIIDPVVFFSNIPWYILGHWHDSRMHTIWLWHTHYWISSDLSNICVYHSFHHNTISGTSILHVSQKGQSRI